MQVVVAGASGFLGTHLKDALTARGHTVVSLVRRPSSAPEESSWDPHAGTYDREVIETADVEVNLAGAPTLGNPHSKKWQRELLTSRVATTRVLAGAIAHGDDLALGGLLLGVVGDDESALGLLFALDAANKDSVVQRHE